MNNKLISNNRLGHPSLFETPIQTLSKLWFPSGLYKSDILHENSKHPEKFLHIQTIEDDIMPLLYEFLASRHQPPETTQALVWGYGQLLVLPFILTTLGFNLSGVEFGGSIEKNYEDSRFEGLERLFTEKEAQHIFPKLNRFRRFSHLEQKTKGVHDFSFVVNPDPSLWVSEQGLTVQMEEWSKWLTPGALMFLQLDGDFEKKTAIAHQIFTKLETDSPFSIQQMLRYPGTDAPFPSYYKNYTGQGNAVLVLKKT
jgi:hypothetical protein